jgi:hypothetical protein
MMPIAAGTSYTAGNNFFTVIYFIHILNYYQVMKYKVMKDCNMKFNIFDIIQIFGK